MTPFDATAQYSPWLALVLGGAGFVGQVGIGSWLLGRVAGPPPGHWRVLAGAHAGGLLASAVVVAIGWAGVASPAVLAAVWGALTVVGLGLAARDLRGTSWPRGRVSASVALVALPLAACTLAGLLAAMAPAHHADSVFYHMVPARRLVEEGALSWARYPFNAAVLVQMVHQLAAAPLHALGWPDAADVSSYGYWLVFLWFARRVLAEAEVDPPWAWLVVAAIGTGMYPVEWYGSGGAHAFGDSAAAGLGVLLVLLPRLQERGVAAPALATVCGVFLAATAGSKISVAPLAAVAFAIAVWRLAPGAAPRERAKVLAGLALPGLLALGPLMLLTWQASGSPFGPYLAGVLGDSAYHLEEIREDIAVTVAGHRPSLRYLGLFWGLFVSPLLWAGVLGYFLWGAGRGVLGLLFAVQAVLLAGWLPFDARYLGGIQYSAVLLCGLAAPQQVSHALRSTGVALAAAVLGLGLWALVGTSHASDHWRVALGLQPAAAYHTSEGSRGAPNTPFFETWLALDEALPDDASLLVYRRWIGAKVSVAYAPRPIYLHPDDVPADRANVYLFWLGRQSPAQISEQLAEGGRWHLGDEVYRSDSVSWQARARGQAGVLRVFSLQAPTAP